MSSATEVSAGAVTAGKRQDGAAGAGVVTRGERQGLWEARSIIADDVGIRETGVQESISRFQPKWPLGFHPHVCRGE